MDFFDAYFALLEGLTEEPDVSEGLSPFCLNGRWGYVDEYGLMVIKPAFSYATPFHEGVAAVFNEDGWGYIDADGDVVFNERYGLGRRVN